MAREQATRPGESVAPRSAGSDTRSSTRQRTRSGKATRSGTVPAQALLLRGWALHLLGTAAGPSPALWAAATRCEPAGWDLFLKIEHCAVALQRRLDADGGWHLLPKPASKLIRSYAVGELFRALSARAQLRTVARLAEQHGWTVMVLKGGVAVAAGELLHLGDLDILVEADRIEEVEAALGRLGFEAQGDATSYHLAPQVMPNALEIEVHRSLSDGTSVDDYRAAAVPLEGEQALWQLGGADHLRFLLRHSTGSHAERTGRLRELLLLGHALRTAHPAEITEVEVGLAAEPRGNTMRAVLDLARALNEQDYTSDPFEPLVLRVYILFHRFLWLSEGRFGLQLLARMTQLVSSGSGAWRAVFAKIRASPMRTISQHPLLSGLDRRARPLADLARHLLGLLSFGAVVACAIVVDITARLTPRHRVT